MFLYNEIVPKNGWLQNFYKEKERNVEGYEKIRKREIAKGNL